jgi:hypothetical protein
MNKPPPFIILLIASAVAASATPTTVNTSDLLLGFKVTDGVDPGSTANLEVDLGNVGLYFGQAPNTNFLVANLATALDAIYSTVGTSDWDTRTDLQWGIAGSNGGSATTINGRSIAADTLWGTALETTPGVQSIPWAASVNKSGQQTPANNIVTMYAGAQSSLNAKTTSFSGTTSVTNSTAVVNGTLPGSFTIQTGTTAAVFGYFTPNANDTFYGGTNFTSLVGTFVALDLYELQPNASKTSTYIGSFGLDSAGLLEFSNTPGFFAASIPEPGVFGAAMGMLVLGPALWRRRLKSSIRGKAGRESSSSSLLS